MNGRLTVGWREWFALPELGIGPIKAKIDTGARTSCLHAFQIDPFEESGIQRIRFRIHPIQQLTGVEQECIADVFDSRVVSDSGGHREERYVIRTPIRLGEEEWPVEITLTDRDTMRFRMLLGRTAMKNRIVVDPSAAFLFGEPQK